MLYGNIKKLCESQKISISQLERDLKFPRSSICKWDDNEPSVTRVKKVADYLKVPIEQLLKNTTEKAQ